MRGLNHNFLFGWLTDRKKLSENKPDFKFIGLVIFIGLLCRAIFWQNYSFGFDQIQIAQNAQAIFSGHPTLIGPRTGPAEMFTGPLIYYVAALARVFVATEFTPVVVALALSLVTGLVLAWLSAKYLSRKSSYYLLLIWAFSPFIIGLDRIAWNPNLIILSAALAFFPLLKKESLQIKDALFLAAGVFLGYQAHFSGLLLVGLVSLCLIYRKSWRYLPIIWAVFVLSLLPTLLFDLRHDWLNLKGVLAIFQNKDKWAFYMFLPRLFNKVAIFVENTGKLFWAGTNAELIGASGLIVWVWQIRQWWSSRNESNQNSHLVVSIIWILLTVLGFAMYRGQTPEYYFLILMPLTLVTAANLLVQINLDKKYLFLALALYAGWWSYATYSPVNSLGIGNQLAVTKYLKNFEPDMKISGLVYDMKPVDSLGLQYLLEQYPLKLDPSGQPVHLIYPYDENSFLTTNFGQIGIWFDPRTNSDAIYLSLGSWIVEVPPDWEISYKLRPEKTRSNLEEYEIRTAEGSIEAWVLDEQNIKELDQTKQNDLKKMSDTAYVWQPTKWQGQKAYFQKNGKQYLITLENNLALLNQVKVIAAR